MAKSVLIAAIIIFVVILAGVWLGVGYLVDRQDGPVVTEARAISGFNKIEVHGSGTLLISQGSEPSLVVEAQRGDLDDIKSTVSGNTLELRTEWSWFTPWRLWHDDDVTYHLTVTDLTRVEAHGSTDIQGQGLLQFDELEISASGSVDVELRLQGRTLTVDTSGSADLALSGTADVLQFKSSGSASLRARDLQSRTASVDCSGSADVELNVSERLMVDISGSGKVAYLGDPEVQSNISGSGGVDRLR